MMLTDMFLLTIFSFVPHILSMQTANTIPGIANDSYQYIVCNMMHVVTLTKFILSFQLHYF